MNVHVPVVYLVDDNPGVLRAVARLLETESIQTVSSASVQEFLSRFDPSIPGCLVLDMVMPGESGLALQEGLQRSGVPLPVVFLSGNGHVPSVVEAMKRGAVDFLTKPVDADALVDAVRRALAMDADRRANDDVEHAMHAKLDTLTAREREILPYLVSGKLNKQIAGALGVVEKTVNVHRTHVMEKLQFTSRAELVRFAERMHIDPDADLALVADQSCVRNQANADSRP